MLALPMSPEVLNFTPSLVTVIHTAPCAEGCGDTASARGLQQRMAHSSHSRACVPDAGQVAADAHELGGGHLDDCTVLGVRDAQVLAVNIHQLQLKVADLVLVWQEREGERQEAQQGVRASLPARELLKDSVPGDRAAAPWRPRGHAPLFSNMNVTVSPLSSAFMVITSSFPAHFSILA